MTEKIREFLQQKRWLQLKKTDWIAVALVGVLLLVVAMPSGGYGKYLAESKKEGTAQEKTEQKYSGLFREHDRRTGFFEAGSFYETGCRG